MGRLALVFVVMMEVHVCKMKLEAENKLWHELKRRQVRMCMTLVCLIVG